MGVKDGNQRLRIPIYGIPGSSAKQANTYHLLKIGALQNMFSESALPEVEMFTVEGVSG